jgi:hypothetical protein
LQQNLSTGEGSGQTVRISNVRSVTHQTSRRRELAPLINCWHCVVDRERRELFAMAGEECIASDHEPACAQSDQVCEDCIVFWAGPFPLAARATRLRITARIAGMMTLRLMGGSGCVIEKADCHSPAEKAL